MYKDVYDKIDELAKAQGLSRRALAQLAGINVNTMSTIYKRRNEKFPEKYLEPIAKALKVSPSEIRNANNLRVFPGTLGMDSPISREIRPVEPARATVGQITSMLEALNRDELKIVAEYVAVLLQDS